MFLLKVSSFWILCTNKQSMREYVCNFSPSAALISLVTDAMVLQRRGGSRTSLLCIWQRIDSFFFAAAYFPPGSVQNKNIDLFCTGKEQITRINITTGTLPCSVGVWERGLLQYATGLIRLCVVLSQALYVVPSQELVQNLCDVFKNQTWMVLFVWSTS